MILNSVSFQSLKFSNPSMVSKKTNNDNQSIQNNKFNHPLQLVDKNYNSLLVKKNPSFGTKSQNLYNVDMLMEFIPKRVDFKFFDELKPIENMFIDKTLKLSPQIYPREGRVIAGTLKTHPHFESSNGTALPKTKEEIMDLYRKHIPEKYQKFIKLGIFDNNDLATVDGKLAGRYAPQDEHTEVNMRKALQQGLVDPQKHVVIVRLGGPHSIAAARELGNSGYFIIPHFNHDKLSFANQDTGALSYFAKEISDINAKTLEKNPNAPWALIIDDHQNDEKNLDKFGKILEDKDIPAIPKDYSAMWLTEGTGSVVVPIWEYSLNLFKNRGAQVFELGLDPYGKGNLFI